MSTMREFDEQSQGAGLGISLVIMLFATLGVIAIYATAVGTAPEWEPIDALGSTWEGLPDDPAITSYAKLEGDADKYQIPVAEAMAAAAKNPGLLAPSSTQYAIPVAEMTPVQRGAAVFVDKGCGTCHTVDGSAKVGPTLKGKWGTQEKLADGSTVLVDAAYIAESIRDPNAKLVFGFSGGMFLSFPVSDEDIELLTVYIQSLAD